MHHTCRSIHVFQMHEMTVWKYVCTSEAHSFRKTRLFSLIAVHKFLLFWSDLLPLSLNQIVFIVPLSFFIYFQTTNSMGGGADYEDRPPVEPYVPAIEVKNRCQPDFSECVGKVNSSLQYSVTASDCRRAQTATSQSVVTLMTSQEILLKKWLSFNTIWHKYKAINFEIQNSRTMLIKMNWHSLCKTNFEMFSIAFQIVFLYFRLFSFHMLLVCICLAFVFCFLILIYFFIFLLVCQRSWENHQRKAAWVMGMSVCLSEICHKIISSFL